MNNNNENIAAQQAAQNRAAKEGGAYSVIKGKRVTLQQAQEETAKNTAVDARELDRNESEAVNAGEVAKQTSGYNIAPTFQQEQMKKAEAELQQAQKQTAQKPQAKKRASKAAQQAQQQAKQAEEQPPKPEETIATETAHKIAAEQLQADIEQAKQQRQKEN